ncbi:phosphopentomutase [Paracoccaceae bacterium]|nr:phosphopentomutase [Paracoccaceae bacterium]
MGKAILIVLDSLGVGGASDASLYSDEGSNTFGSIALACSNGKANIGRKGALKVPNLESLGIYSATRLSTGLTLPNTNSTVGSYAVAVERSKGKDTPTGHHEIVGFTDPIGWHTFPEVIPVFPEEQMNTLIQKAHLNGVLGNMHASGEDIIKEYGEEHLKRGHPIVYTSADSVLQIAAHETVFGLDRLYRTCELAAEIFNELRVQRIIARPFLGNNKKEFSRTKNRRDFISPPPIDTLCDKVIKSGKKCFGIGKIADIFGHRGISDSVSGKSDDKLFNEMLDIIVKANAGDLIFANFVEFDTLYGHKRDVSGYARALENFDKKLPKLFSILNKEDLLVITADHGNDPSFAGTDHTREQVPVLIKKHNLMNKCYGLINFSDIGSLIEDFLGLKTYK